MKQKELAVGMEVAEVRSDADLDWMGEPIKYVVVKFPVARDKRSADVWSMRKQQAMDGVLLKTICKDGSVETRVAQQRQLMRYAEAHGLWEARKSRREAEERKYRSKHDKATQLVAMMEQLGVPATVQHDGSIRVDSDMAFQNLYVHLRNHLLHLDPKAVV